MRADREGYCADLTRAPLPVFASSGISSFRTSMNCSPEERDKVGSKMMPFMLLFLI